MMKCTTQLALQIALASTVTACDRLQPPASTPASNPEIAWAATALARNPELEVLATDSSAGVFTVRIKPTGEVRTVRLTDIAAAPIALLAARAQPVPAAVPTPATPSEPPASTATAQTPPIAAPPPVTAAPSPSAAIPDAAVANQSTPATAPAADAPNYTIDRAGGHVKISGPGVSIVSTGQASSHAPSTSEFTSNEAIICEGARLLHLDNRTIAATGNAIVARGGCELYLTNSHVNAAATAIVVEDAVVHIANSTIEGGVASLDAGDRSHVLVRSSTFKGMQKRSERADIQDQGGNQWR